MTGSKGAAPRPFHLTIQSDDRDELSGCFSSRISKVEIAPLADAGAVSISARVASLGEAIALHAKIPRGASFRQAEDLDGFFVNLPAGSGSAHWTIGARQFVCDASVGYLGPMNEHDAVDFIGPWEHKTLKIPYAPMARSLSVLLDAPLGARLTFAPTIDLATAPIRDLIAVIDLALAPGEGAAFLATSPLAAAQFSEWLSLLLLENFRHSYTDAMAPGRQGLKPSHIRRAMEFMQESAHLPLTLHDIASAAGVSVRALHYGFKNFAGESPFEHLRKVRLRLAYRDLTAYPELSVADIARKWGFTNPTRFAQLCKASYGLSPSEIRRLRRRTGEGGV